MSGETIPLGGREDTGECDPDGCDEGSGEGNAEGSDGSDKAELGCAASTDAGAGTDMCAGKDVCVDTDTGMCGASSRGGAPCSSGPDEDASNRSSSSDSCSSDACSEPLVVAVDRLCGQTGSGSGDAHNVEDQMTHHRSGSHT